MTKRADLAAALADQAGSTRRKVEAPPPPSQPLTNYQQPSRVGTRPITAHMPKEVRSQLKILAVEREKTMHELMAEALNDLFAKYGKPEVAPRA